MSYGVVSARINEHIRSATAPSNVFINALSDAMPACDLKRGVIAAQNIERGDACHVYCAQASCSAAKDYIAAHAQDFDRCSAVHYLSQGAIEIDATLLIDGDACHAAIRAWNER